MIRLKSEGLTWKLTRIVVGVALLFGISLNVLQIALDFRSEEERAGRIVSQIIDSTLPAAADIAYKLDRSGAEELIHGLLVYEFVSEAALYDDAGKILAREQSITRPETSTRWLTKLLFSEFDERTTDLYKDTEAYSYGKLHLIISNDIIYAELYSRALNVFTSGLARNLLLSLVLLIIFYVLLARPLTKIASFFSETDPETNRTARLPSLANHKKDEIGEIIRGANSYLDSSEKNIGKYEETMLKLEESNRHIRTVLDTCAEGFIRTDADAAISETNPSMEKILGLPADALCGQPVMKYIREKDIPVLASQFEKRREGLQTKFNLRFVNSSGTEIPCSVSGTPVFDDNGIYAGAFGFITDISDIVNAEVTRKKLEAELFQIRKMESIGTLAGGIAHDFNNILAAIIGFAELAMDETDENSAIQEDISEILASALRGKDLVTQILAFSKQLHKERTALSLADVIGDALEIIDPEIPTDVELIIDLNPSVKPVVANAERLRQAIVSLCTNSLQAMEDGGGQFTIRLTSEHAPLNTGTAPVSEHAIGYAHLVVQDTGVGIAESNINRVCDPFFTTREVGKGSGLGLSFVHGIIKECDGKLEIESKQGKGTTIHVYLPETEVE